MAQIVTQTMTVQAGTVLTYTYNTDNGRAVALYLVPETHFAPSPSVINYGEIHYSDTSRIFGHSSFFFFDNGGTWDAATIENYGLIRANMPNLDSLTMFQYVSNGPDFFNSGTITGVAKDYISGFESHSLTQTVTNSGLIEVSAAKSANAVSAGASGQVTNAGHIVARLTGAASTNDLIGATGVSFPSGSGGVFGSTLLNTSTGIIEAFDNDPTVALASGVVYGGNSMGPIINEGIIRGDYAIREYTPFNASPAQAGAYIRNSGLLEGLLWLGIGEDILENNGEIIGNVELGSENDIYDGQLGVVFGNVLGGDGNDQLNGGAQADRLFGQAGADTLDGASGEDFLEGGAAGDFYFGGNGLDTVSYETSSAAVSVDLESGVRLGGDSVGDVFDSIEGFSGSVFDDAFYADANANRLVGNGGNDWLEGRGGADVIDGSIGEDVAAYGSSAAVSLNLATNTFTGGDANGDTLIDIEGLSGSQFADSITGDALANRLYGLGGNDTIVAGGGNDLLDGGLGDDVLTGDQGNDTAAYAGNAAVALSLLLLGPQDTLGAGIDTLSGIENVTGGNGNDTLTGNEGANVLNGFHGDDTLDGGAGSDTASYAGVAAGVTVSLTVAGAQSTGGAGIDTLTGIENLTGSAFNDTLTGNANDNVLAGGFGQNVLDGGAGNDTVSYADLYIESGLHGVNVSVSETGSQWNLGGFDTYISIENLVGSRYRDALVGDENANALYGGDENDNLTGFGGDDWLEGGAGEDGLFGVFGNDVAAYTSSAAAVYIDLLNLVYTGGDAEGDYLGMIEGVAGSAHNDQLLGDNGANRLLGQGGDDRLVGRGGADALDGGGGTIDIADYAASAAAVIVDLQTGTGSGGDAAGDTLLNVEGLEGSAFNDQLFGDANANRLLGNGGADFIQGRGGADNIQGGDGDDWLDGGTGGDTINGGNGTLDIAAYGGSTAAVNLDLQANTFSGGDATGDVLSNIEGVSGSGFND
ncbi:MAG: beta strand repeat-containing protein, partial [Micropepsaceae bacterium]